MVVHSSLPNILMTAALREDRWVLRRVLWDIYIYIYIYIYICVHGREVHVGRRCEAGINWFEQSV